MYLIPSCIDTIELSSIACISIYCRVLIWWLIINHDFHNTLYVLRCGILLDSLVGASMRLFALRMKKIWYEGWKFLYISVDLLVPLGSHDWDHLGLRLTGLCDVKFDCQISWCWEHLLDPHLDITLTCFLAYHWDFHLPYTSSKDIIKSNSWFFLRSY